ncbi:polysaccharide deacetylase family protein [Rubrolithibacter danxiaensis]|uniref:polysaccharide deacetylase family protein n=1 Tax=Rubrolithibacter danxiaensis TaxID=3390805 RepID=UPI003BF88D28
MVFTGDEFGDGAEVIQQTLKKNNIQASFFLTGNFYRNKTFSRVIKELRTDGNYLGAHSDKHLLYADWVKRDSLLVSEKQFKQDLRANYREMKKFGISKSETRFFLPAYEWYNSSIVNWAKEEGMTLVNFTPGTRSNADYAYPEMGDKYLSSLEILQSVLNYEAKDPNGLNGFILLLHLGTDPRRTDKFYNKLDELLATLKSKGYIFKRIDALLN